MTSPKMWDPAFLSAVPNGDSKVKIALIVLNQPFKEDLFLRLWSSASWRACADGGANRLYDLFFNEEKRIAFLPDLIKGDFDSIREDVKAYYSNKGVKVIYVSDQDSTDLQKCLYSLSELETSLCLEQHTVLLLGGLSGRLDQTVHTLSFLHKLRKTRDYIYVVTEENVGWVLDSVGSSIYKILARIEERQGEHTIRIDLERLGPTCGLLPVGVNETILSTRGLRWNLTDATSSFDGLISTSNHVVSSEVWVKTSHPIWWCIERRSARQ